MRAVQQIESHPFVCECEKNLPEAEQTRFWITQLTPIELAYVEDGYFGKTEDGNTITRAAVQAINALHLGLDRVENLPRSDGTPTILERDLTLSRLPGGKHPWKQSSLAAIEKAARGEVAKKIIDDAYLDETTRKN